MARFNIPKSYLRAQTLEMVFRGTPMCRMTSCSTIFSTGDCAGTRSRYHTHLTYKSGKSAFNVLTSSQIFHKLVPHNSFALSKRHNSTSTSLLSKIFCVNAASPVPDEVKTDVSDTGAQAVIETVGYIPAPPAAPELVSPALNALGEPTIQSLGLGGWTPVGLIQNSLDFLHVSVDLPWWAAIAIATVCIRTMIFPLVLIAQRNAAKMNNNMPQLQVLQMKMTEARNSGNQLEAARLGQEMMTFMKEKDISPMKNVLVPLAQAPIFISMFMGLRKMATVPVESMKDGGLFWFVDLTLSDPYYLLPIVTSITMMATIELGTDGAKLNAQNMSAMKWVLRGMPILIFPFTLQFPAAVLCYWVSTNLFSLIQVAFLKIPAIRSFCKIDKLVTHRPETLPQKKKGMVESFKDSWSNMQISKEIEERQRYDEMRFSKAGTGPVVRTYRHDPTKRKPITVKAKVKS